MSQRNTVSRFGGNAPSMDNRQDTRSSALTYLGSGTPLAAHHILVFRVCVTSWPRTDDDHQKLTGGERHFAVEKMVTAPREQ